MIAECAIRLMAGMEAGFSPFASATGVHILAAAAEQLSQEAAVRAAWQQGGRHERNRVTALIDLQLDQLNRSGVNAGVLATLRRMVLEVEA